MAKTNISQEFDYNRLLDDLLKIKKKIEGRVKHKVNKILLEGYWQMGKRLSLECFLEEKPNTGKGSVFTRLSEDLGVEYTLLTRVVKFFKVWPKCPADQFTNISWSHYKSLMAISDSSKRLFYLQEAAKNSWNKQELSHRIKSEYFEAVKERPLGARAVLLRRGERMYCFSGDVLRVVDGDTLVVSTDLGFGVKIKTRVRLRGINTEEIKDEDEEKRELGALARAFVVKQFEHVERIVFQTFKVDLYGRYVADVFYLPGEVDREKIFQKGRYLNQDLLDAGLAEMV